MTSLSPKSRIVAGVLVVILAVVAGVMYLPGLLSPLQVQGGTAEARAQSVAKVAASDSPAAPVILARAATGESDPSVRSVAAATLGHRQSPEGRTAAEACLKDSDTGVRVAGSYSLSRYADDAAVVRLRDAATTDPEPRVRAAALAGLTVAANPNGLIEAVALIECGHRETEIAAAKTLVKALGIQFPVERENEPRWRHLVEIIKSANVVQAAEAGSHRTLVRHPEFVPPDTAHAFHEARQMYEQIRKHFAESAATQEGSSTDKNNSTDKK